MTTHYGVMMAARLVMIKTRFGETLKMVHLCNAKTKIKMKKKEKKYSMFNIVEGSEGCTILMYGYIGSYDDISSKDMAQEILSAESRYGKIAVRINSLGGEVLEAIAIFNQLMQCKADVSIYIDGVAASAASFIATCGRHVEMSKYARLMIHEVSGGCYGNKEDMKACADQMQSLEDTLCEMYAAKCGKSKDEIRSTYFDGKDHWLTADEALQAGLIDGIYDADPVEGVKSAEDIYNIFNNRLEKEAQKRKKMSFFENFKKRPKFANCTSDEEATQVVDELEKDSAEKDRLSKENAALKAEKSVRDKSLKEASDKKKKDLLDAAENDGRIDAKTRPSYQALLDADMEKGETALNALNPKKKVKDVISDVAEINPDGPWAKRQAEIENRYKERV